MLPDLCQSYITRAQSRQLILQWSPPPSLAVHGDPILLRSIIINLVDNAVEYAAPAGAVIVHAATAGSRFELSVENPVEDLAEEELPRLFDRFWGKDLARSSNRHSGLGLSLARSLASCLGCTLTPHGQRAITWP